MDHLPAKHHYETLLGGPVPLTADGLPACGARARSHPGHCKKRRGWGTPHVGYGKCKIHGGCTPSGIKAAMEEAAQLESIRLQNMVMGVAIDIHPMDALLMTVRIAAGEVAYSTRKIAELRQEDEVVRPESETERRGGGENVADYEVTRNPEELNLWVRVRQQAMDRLAKFSKMALDAGAEERRVRVAEQAGEGLASAIRLILDGLQLSPTQEVRAPELVRNALELLERGDTIEGRLLP